MNAARFTALSRIAIGGSFVVTPSRAMRPWIGSAASAPQSRLLARALGTRDVVLGLGTLSSSATCRRPWLTAALAADAADLLLTLVTWKHLPRRGRATVAAIAGSGVALGAVALSARPS